MTKINPKTRTNMGVIKKRSRIRIVLWVFLGIIISFLMLIIVRGRLIEYYSYLFSWRNIKISLGLMKTPQFDGYVYDEETTRPIKGAQIFAAYIGNAGPWEAHVFSQSVAETDDVGYYSLPFVKLPADFDWATFDLFIYKKGYIVYGDKGGFRRTYKEPFKQYNNIVKLKKWNFPEGDHFYQVSMLRRIQTYCDYIYYPIPNRPQNNLLKSLLPFCAEAKNEFTEYLYKK